MCGASRAGSGDGEVTAYSTCTAGLLLITCCFLSVLVLRFAGPVVSR